MPPKFLDFSDFAKEKSYRFGQSQRNMLERSTTKFHDPRYQKRAGNDNYQASDFHGGKARSNYSRDNDYNNNNSRTYRNNNKYDNHSSSSSYNNNNNNYNSQRHNNYYNNNRSDSSSYSRSNTNRNSYTNDPPASYTPYSAYQQTPPVYNQNVYNPTPPSSSYSPFASQYSNPNTAYSMGYTQPSNSRRNDEAPYNPAAGYAAPYYPPASYPPQQQSGSYLDYPTHLSAAQVRGNQYHHTAKEGQEKDKKPGQYYNWNSGR